MSNIFLGNVTNKFIIFIVARLFASTILILISKMLRYIDEIDLRRFMLKEEVDFVFPLIDVADTGQIDRKALTEWVVNLLF